MGCDIHMFKEKLVDGKWVSADEWVAYDYGDDEKGVEVPFTKRFTERNYQLFGLLSKGVRCDHPYAFAPRGIPFDCCPEVAADYKRWDCDAHSANFLFLPELKAMREHLKRVTIEVSGMKDADELKALRQDIAKGSPDWSKLFPYCGWTSATNYEEFTLEVPADFYMGKSLQKLIDMFDGIEGDNHRVVFWFDN